MKTVLSIAALLFVASGTGQGGEKVEVNDLKLLGVAYHDYISSQGQRKAPQKVEDLLPLLEKANPDFNPKRVIAHLKEKRVHFIYGIRPQDMKDGSATTIVAYEKDAPSKGGVVLFGDGTATTLTVDQFKKTPKAKK